MTNDNNAIEQWHCVRFGPINVFNLNEKKKKKTWGQWIRNFYMLAPGSLSVLQQAPGGTRSSASLFCSIHQLRGEACFASWWMIFLRQRWIISRESVAAITARFLSASLLIVSAFWASGSCTFIRGFYLSAERRRIHVTPAHCEPV